MGIAFERPLLIAVAEAGLVAALLLLLYGAHLRDRVRVTRYAPTRAVEEDDVAVRLEVRSTTPLRAFLVELADWFSAEDQPEKKLLLTGVSARAPASARYAGRCDRGRGLYPIGPAVLRLSDPLGLFLFERRFEESSPLLVLPRSLPIDHLPLEGPLTAPGGSSENMARPGASSSFYGTREYRAGDNIRHIHWRSSARWGRLVLKEFEALCPRELTILLDLDRHSARGVLGQQHLELAIRMIASIAEVAAAQGLPFQVMAQGSRDVHLPPGSGAGQLSLVLETLATLGGNGLTPYSEAILSRLPLIPEGSVVVLLLHHLDYDAEAVSAAAAALSARGARVAAYVIDDGRFVRFHPRPPELAERKMAELEEALSRAGAAVHRVPADLPVHSIFASEHAARV
jgi:uncharacterized protein (DUF58 family)